MRPGTWFLLVLGILQSGCAVKPAPMCIFCDQEVDGQIHTGHKDTPPTTEQEAPK